MASPIGSNIVANSGIVVARGGVFANVLSPGGAPHPAAGTGGTWIDVDSTDLWDDEDAIDPAEYTEGEAIRRADVSEAAGSAAYVNIPSSNYAYSPGTHATPRGQASLYCGDDTFGVAGLFNDAAKVQLQASGELTGRQFGRVMVVKRLSTTDNVEISRLGSNKPYNSRTNGADSLTCYGFVSGFVQAIGLTTYTNDGWHVVAYRWNESTTELEVSVDGGAWQASVGGDAAWSPDTGEIAWGRGSQAIAFDWYFDGDPDTLNGYTDLAEFIVAIGLYYGVYRVVSNVHWQGNTDSLINWSGGEASNGQLVQYLENSINTYDPASYIRDPFNNGSGTRVDGAFTGHSGLRSNAFGSQYFVRNAANNADVAPTEFLSASTFLIYAAGVHNAAAGGAQRVWGSGSADIAVRTKADGAGIAFRFNSDQNTEYLYEVALSPGQKWTVVAGLQSGLLTVYINGTLVADQVVVDGPAKTVASNLAFDYSTSDETAVVLGAGKLNGTKAVVTLVSDDLEARRAA